MSKEPELKARDKVVVRMTREGAVEENLTAGTEQRVSKRLEDALHIHFFPRNYRCLYPPVLFAFPYLF